MGSDADFKYRYLSKESIQALKDFKYNGADHSLLYKHILSPLADFLVNNATPSTIAPNTITLFGFSFMILSFILIAMTCPTLDHCRAENDVPSYIFLVNGISILVYQTLDNMDGKQARKTGSSSPLGLLFDHGLDAWNTVLAAVNTICALGIASDDFFCIAAVIFSTGAAFFVATWEEYHTHKLVLPIMNGPNEGVITTAMISFVSWWMGPQYWHQYGVYEMVEPFLPALVKDMLPEAFQTGMANKDLLLLVLVVFSAREVAAKIINVVPKYGLKSLSGLIPLVTLMILSVLIVKSNPQVLIQNQRVVLYLYGVIFVEMVMSLMLDHMTRNKFDPFRNTLVPVFILYSIVDLKVVPMNYISVYILVCTSGISSLLMKKTKTVITEICNALGIWVFDIVTPHPNSEKKTK